MPDSCEKFANYFLKSVSVGLTVAGIVLSWRASHTCEFISFVDSDGSPPDGADAAPFNRAIAANIGIFRYEITEMVGGGETDCLPYRLRFSEQQDYPSLGTAQFCAVIGPCFAVLGGFLTLVECFVCNGRGSFMLASLFHLVGAGIQAGVFTLVADPAFCFRGSKVECEQRKGVYMAAAAAILFFLAACFQCCSPHSADPFCFNFGRELERPEPRKKKETQTAVSEQDDRYEEPENDDYYVEEAEPTPPSPPPKRKPSTSKEMVEYKSPTKRKQSINRERRFD